jgi:hypothetical protein
LRQNDVPVTAGGWMKESDAGFWYLYLVTPLVGEGGGRRLAYRRILGVIRGLPGPLQVDPFQIKAVGPWEPVGKAILEAQQSHSGRRSVRFGEGTLGGVEIEAAYVYGTPVVTVAP